MRDQRPPDEESAPLSPDLDWMLPDSRVGDQALAAFLAGEYSAALAGLAAYFLDDPDQVNRLVCRVLARAILERHRFRGDTTGRAWLLALGLDEFRRAFGWGRRRTERDLPLLRAAIRDCASGGEVEDHLLQTALALEEAYYLPLALYYAQGLALEEAAYVIERSPQEIKRELAVINAALMDHQESCAVCRRLPGGLRQMEQRLGSALQSCAQRLDYEQVEKLQQEVLLQVTKKRRQGRIANQVKEIALIGVMLVVALVIGSAANRIEMDSQAQQQSASLFTPGPTPGPSLTYIVRQGDTLEGVARQAGISTGELLTFNRLSPGAALYPGKVLRLPGAAPIDWLAPPPPFTPSASPPALSGKSTLEEIQQRTAHSKEYWQTLWADVQVINYGLTGFTGPPQSQVRKQVWIRQPSLMRVISGPADGDPNETYAVSGGHVYAQNLVGGAVYEYLSDAWPFDFELEELFLPQAGVNSDGRFELAGEDRIANRLALVLDRINSDGKRIYRICVDEVYGVLLCRREYGGEDFNTVLVDTIVSSIDFDVDFPPSIFDPFLFPGDHFARDPYGQPAGPTDALAHAIQLPSWMAQTGHERLSYPPAPQGYDPAKSRLTFQTPADSQGQPGLDVFAGNYYLGRLPASGDSILACERSKDGERIAYSLLPGRAGSGAANLFWTDLSAVEHAHPVGPGGRLVGDFAISADDRLLAYFGCQTGTNQCAVFVLDTVTNRQEQLISLAFADYLLWKPDGTQIALLGSQRGQDDWTYNVIDIASKVILDREPFDWKQLEARPDSPAQGWGLPFQAQANGLQGCTDLPG